MTYAELSEAQARRSRQFAKAQTDAMSVYCDAERDLKELQTENAKLREQGERLFDKTLELGTENSKLRELCKLCEREAENAKLRELAEKAWKAAEMLCQAWDGPCHADGVSIMPPCPLDERDELCVYGLIQRDLRELGVGVD